MISLIRFWLLFNNTSGDTFVGNLYDTTLWWHILMTIFDDTFDNTLGNNFNTLFA